MSRPIGARRGGARPAAGAAAVVAAGLLGGAAWAGADGMRRLRRLERLVERSDLRTARRTDNVIRRMDEQAPVVRSLAGVEDRLVRSVDASVATRLAPVPERVLELLEPVVWMSTLLRPRAAMPSLKGFSAAGDLLLTYVGEILRRRPQVVVECGSGVSTLVAAYALEMVGEGGRVVALEDGEQWAARTRGFLSDHGLTEHAEVRHAPIREVEVGGERRPWYSPEAVEDLEGIGVLLVDGPVGSLHEMARYPAVPLLRDRFAPGAAILLDDVGRAEEDRTAHRWVQEWPELTQTRLRHVKGTALLVTP